MNTEILGNKISLGISILLDPFIKYMTSPAERRNTRYTRYYKHCSVKRNTILYEAFYGRGLLCGPFALFQELVHNARYSKFRHVWVLDDLENHRELIQKYKGLYKNVSFVQFGSKKYLKYLASAGYLINNVAFYSFFVKKPGQVYINTWHGIPLKHLGYDEPSGALTASNMARNFLHADYLISANPFLTDVYKRAFRQDGISKAKIIEEGYPRLDLLVNTKKEDVYSQLKKAGVSIDPKKKMILYAPTWRGDSYANPNCGLDHLIQLKETLEKRIDTNEYQILVKVHQVVYSMIKEELDKFSYVVPATIDANVILSVTDILISDFSSIYFDFLATGRPVLFYITDLEEYSVKRGMYFGMEDLPGPNTDRLDVLAGWINDIDKVFQESRERYEKVRDWCCTYDIGHISQKIVRAIFDGETEGIRITGCDSRKKKVLISRGPMLVNGISTALINLLSQFDYSKYDVTVFVDKPVNAAQKEQILRMDSNKNVRVIVRPDAMIRTIGEFVRNNFYIKCNPVKGLSTFAFSKKLYRREFRRLYGESEFDYIIDYEGYNIFYATICLMQASAKTCIWLHNDMLSEFEEKYFWLKRVFALYPKFDCAVCCSREIMEVNREKLAGYLKPEKFGYAKNCVDFEKVKDGSRMGKLLFNGTYYYAFSDKLASVTDMKLIPLQPDILDELGDGTMEIRANTGKVENGVTRFVNIGRLSVEKNQEALIRAFARLEKEYPEVMLYIIGDGTEKNNLLDLICQLGLQEKVILTGNLSNPFGLLRQCDCFILPSLHEGQPLVVFEARAMHMPIILSRFSSVGGSVIENGQCLVDMDADSIYEGMCRFMAGGVPSRYAFDDEEYNREAYAEFERAALQ